MMLPRAARRVMKKNLTFIQIGKNGKNFIVCSINIKKHLVPLGKKETT